MKIVVVITRLIFRVFRLFPQQNKIAFMSRQGSRPLDFRLLEPELKAQLPEWQVTWACVKESGKMSIKIMLRQLWHAATARLCVVDGYVPAVCLCEGLHRAPCVQLWHALGAIKKFGLQALDTPAGRPSKMAHDLYMHKGYDSIIAGLPGAIPAYAAAFGYPQSNIKMLGLPRIDYLNNTKNKQATKNQEVLTKIEAMHAKGLRVVLYAPTFRRNNEEGQEWLSREIKNLRQALSDFPIGLVVAHHPVQSVGNLCQPDEKLVYLSKVSAIRILWAFDYVITDYSAIAFESWVAGLDTYFYVPDIEEYRRSPGLNVDPEKEFPDRAFRDAPALINALQQGEKSAALSSFMDRYIGQPQPHNTKRLASYLKELALPEGA